MTRLRETFQFCDQALAGLDDSELTDQLPMFGGKTMTRAAVEVLTVAYWADHGWSEGDLAQAERSAAANRQAEHAAALPWLPFARRHAAGGHSSSDTHVLRRVRQSISMIG